MVVVAPCPWSEVVGQQIVESGGRFAAAFRRNLAPEPLWIDGARLASPVAPKISPADQFYDHLSEPNKSPPNSPVKQSAVDRPQTVPARLPFFLLAAVAADNVRVPGNVAPSGLLAFPDKCPLGGIARAAASHENRRSFSRGWARGPGQRFRNTARRAVCRNTPCTVTRSTSGVPAYGPGDLPEG